MQYVAPVGQCQRRCGWREPEVEMSSFVQFGNVAFDAPAVIRSPWPRFDVDHAIAIASVESLSFNTVIFESERKQIHTSHGVVFLHGHVGQLAARSNGDVFRFQIFSQARRCARHLLQGVTKKVVGRKIDRRHRSLRQVHHVDKRPRTQVNHRDQSERINGVLIVWLALIDGQHP
ncbi:MAG: hypothetical protein M2R45_01940 [Verrucomicrobia subdivision 3 bacterium]|nr:hypothetical protein [Limisphaerales bacterium]MCS1416194.1 hypothetical protein [Limisphaerales bacterium]